ncbi:MAG: EAL domain-containing protein [Xanthomonadaceae bacterium]|nr:EAL domain-containing protein [Xanthomonadaceae bacterium]MDP2184535.1 EAL domain-containing protein [Xanthomonadales bacterium]MDZ4115080.1 EAL domain-containing protein [Xanthomonadaceae bacterium]MDZ4377498.1 EAL domain-containing protein [Xanthomonadaceae bacterium]
MAQAETVLRVLLVEDRVEDAEQITSILRNGGIAVRPARAESPEDFTARIASFAPDLVLAATDARTVPFATVLATVRGSNKDLTVIATCLALTEDTLLNALEAGARNVVVSTSPEHVQIVVKHEFEALLARRALRRIEAALRETERRCDSLIDSSREPIAYIHEGMHIRANSAYLEMFGYESFEEIEGLSVLDLIAPAHTDRFKQLLKDLSKGEHPPKSLHLDARNSDSSTFEAELEFAQASYEGEPCLQIIFRQRGSDPELERKYAELRERDALTGLYNRQHFLSELEQTVAKAVEGQPDQAVLLIEPDNIANLVAEIGINDIDEFVTAMAARIEAIAGESHMAARFSEHGFALLCHGVNHDQTQALAEKIQHAFSDHIIEAGDRSVSVTISIGGVQIGERIASLNQVLTKASQCLQNAQAEGGNRKLLFDPAAQDRQEQERIAQWVEAIKAAIASNDGFVLHYQPIVSLQGEPGGHYESLLRMRHSKGELVPPMTFLPIAEEHGLLEAIDLWVVSHAIDALAKSIKSGHETALFVKISPLSMASDALPKLIAKQLAANKLPGKCLILEVPEAKVFTNLKAAQEFQQALAPLGVRMALEQFGSGLNSFQLLRHFDPAFLKIDRSFMSDLGKNAENQKKVVEIARQAHEAGKQTIAEFVQDAATMSVLFSSGVSLVEGHFLATAGPEMNYDFG